LDTFSNLVYQSVANDLSVAEIANIVMTGRSKNYSRNVRGLLIYDSGFFYQWLEGSEAGIDQAFKSIKNDSRHSEIIVLSHDFLNFNLFEDSFLRFVSKDIDITPFIAYDIHRLSEKFSDMLLEPALVTNVLAHYGSLTD
jgi:hypothetical protein